MPAKKPLTPGTKTPSSGQYGEVGSRGGKTGKEITAVKGKTLPPASKKGNRYVLNDATNNKAGRGK